MTTSYTPDKYNKYLIILHWFMLLLLAAVFLTIEFRGIFPKGSDGRSAMKMWHFMLGLSVLCLVTIRLIIRFKTGTPAIIPKPPQWQHLLANIMHFTLYAFMFAMPLAGWAILSAEGQNIPFFGLSLPPLIGVDKALAHAIEDIHATAGGIAYYVIGFHALAGLMHHFYFKDNTFKRMLPK